MRKFSIRESSGMMLISLLCCAIFVNVHGAARTLTTELNPGCPLDICNEDDDTKTLIHVKADGDNDTLHYIWDFNRQPTVLVALTERNSNLTIKWNQISKDAGTVTFSSKPKYTMSFVLTKIFAFNDIKDRATIIGVNASDIHVVDTKDLTWSREEWNSSSAESHVEVAGGNNLLLGEDGAIKLKLKCFGTEDHDNDIPHLLHSINVTQIDIEFINVTANATFHSSRVGVEFVLVANETSIHPFTISERKTIDDEHTPGTFKMIDIVSPDGVNGTQGSYVQFRPNSYTNERRELSSQTGVHLNEPLSIADPKTYLNNSLVASYNGFELEKSLVQSFNVTFGQSEDGFYTATNYTTWTLVLGYGSAPPERVSLLVVIIACIGMGIPLILLIAGGVYLAIKRMRNC